MKKYVVVFFITLVAVWGLYAQNEIDPNEVGVLTAQQELKEISVSKLEDAGLWRGSFSRDNGLIQVRSHEGTPINKVPITDEEQFGISEPDEKVLGAKVSFFRRGIMDFTIKPLRPIPIEGITKTLSVWVIGRNANHSLELLVSDQFGNRAVIPMGKLNFSGWKKLTVTIPPHIKQRDYHYSDRMGITVDGFNVKCAIDETYGRYYIYFDDLRAVTDLFAEENRDVDDMSDAW